MLAELAAANAAFAVIKAAIHNGGELVAAGQKIFEYFDAKAHLQKSLNKKTASGRDPSDMEEFFALQQLKQHEEEFKELLIYQGRPGLWDDWVKFQAHAARKRKEAAEAEHRAYVKQQQFIQSVILYGLLTICTIVFIAVALVIIV